MPIKSKDLVAQAKKQNAANLAAAFKSGDEEKMSAAMATFCSDIHDAVLEQAAQELDMRNQDNAVLAARGLHALTSAEMNYYTKLGEAIKADNPKMALENFDVAMPQTIIDGVIGTIKKNHPLLDRINFRNTAYLTRFVLNSKPGQMAKWGKITSAIEKELSGSLKEINLTLCKLSAFMCISQDLVDLGPQWLDQYVRETLAEAIAMALETGVVDGTGKDEPIGMTRDVSSTASVQDGVYPRQTAKPLLELSPRALGAIVADIARDPLDPTKARTVESGDLIFLCNPFDYWKRVMPATTYRKPDGTWIRDLLPIPADIMQTAALEEGRALLGMPSKYFAGLGVYSKKGVIVQDDSVRFFEDERAYKTKLQGNARPMDEYAFVLLDISNLQIVLPFLVEQAAAADE
ncbi:MAG: phage major capsid protein [Oscillospiraceae bacterium]|nr:phage major capsid protein [Oscillospiraceae bacterium]